MMHARVVCVLYLRVRVCHMHFNVYMFVHSGFSSISAAVAVKSLQTPTYVAVVVGPVRSMSSAGAGMLR